MNCIDKSIIKMNAINSSSLFHFTKSFDILKKIIVNGLRYSFAYEQLPKEVVRSYLYSNLDKKNDLEISNGVAIPMISFCDIPITRASQHIDKYGQYMIGLDKLNFAKAFENLINPVIYVHSPNLSDAITRFGLEYSKASNELFKMLTKKEFQKEYGGKLPQELLNNKEFIAKIDSFIQTRFLSNFLMGLIKPIEDETHYYYDEREWRLFLPEHTNDINWVWCLTKEEYEQNRNSWNKDLEEYKDGFIKIPWECYDEYITHIVVSKDEETDSLIELIMESNKILGYDNDVDYSRMKLISKITSFERIEKDF